MASPWNKGLTKNTSSSVKKISDTMRKRKIDNFAGWRKRAQVRGDIKAHYPELIKNGDLAELIGVILGDGYIGKFPRTESLRIVGNSNNNGFVRRYSALIESVFEKAPRVAKRIDSNAINITFYEKHIGRRLRVHVGAQGDRKIGVPKWIEENRLYIIRYLRGLYEAEGSLNFHKPTYTHKFIFSNKNESMLNNVFRLVRKLGFHPHRSRFKIQISRKQEVQNIVNLLQFRRY